MEIAADRKQIFASVVHGGLLFFPRAKWWSTLEEVVPRWVSPHTMRKTYQIPFHWSEHGPGGFSRVELED